jgi:hypothetical protein
VTITDDMIARGSLWLSLRNGATIDPRGGTVPPPPEPSSGRFLYTDAQVTTFRTRMSGAGPFYQTGQAFDGFQSNAPGDGERALANAATFMSNPVAARWAVPVPLEAWVTPEPPVSTIRPMRAAWCFMTLPNNSNASSWRAEAKAYLLWTADHPNHNFANSDWYSHRYAGSYPNPIFAIAGWMYRNLKVYDLLGRESFTTAELTRLDKWFYTWANFMLNHFEREGNNGRMPNLVSGDTSVVNDSRTTGYTNQIVYDGGPNVAVFGAFTNRSNVCLSSAAIIANYLKFHNVQPATTGTQPSYGWWTVDFMLTYLTTVTRAWMLYSLASGGWTYDFHRSGASSTQGWLYAINEVVGIINIAKFFARRGDNTIWNYSTTDGRNNTAGSPNTLSSVSGFPAKNMNYASWMMSRYVNDGWGRRLYGNPMVPSATHHDCIAAAITSRQYPSDTLLSSAWRRSGNGFPGYVSNPQSQGAFNANDGELGTYIGLIEVGGV